MLNMCQAVSTNRLTPSLGIICTFSFLCVLRHSPPRTPSLRKSSGWHCSPRPIGPRQRGESCSGLLFPGISQVYSSHLQVRTEPILVSFVRALNCNPYHSQNRSCATSQRFLPHSMCPSSRSRPTFLHSAMCRYRLGSLTHSDPYRGQSWSMS